MFCHSRVPVALNGRGVARVEQTGLYQLNLQDLSSDLLVDWEERGGLTLKFEGVSPLP